MPDRERLRLEPLPIDDHVEAIRARVRAARAVVVTAAPGAGKTTRVPPALADDGPVLLLQPRRVAARAIARRIAFERGWTVGREVGWHIRGERRFERETRLIVATEGILTARLQQDPLATGLRTIVIDEFHERSVHADLGLALAREAWRARSDLALVVMSATLDAARVAAYLDDCPVVDVPGRPHALAIEYRPGVAVPAAVADALPRADGALLCFLPGAPEIRRTAEALASVPAAAGVDVLPLHGGLDADAQDAAIASGKGRRVILATNLAETTLTVPDVSVVIDTGLHKVARYDADRAIDSLETERITLDSADQRAGRAGRVRAGVAIRLWDARDRLRPHREPEIARIDLSGAVLDVLAWGGDPRTLAWFDPPPAGAIDRAMSLLERLGAVTAEGRLTPLGRQLRRLPLHPRLGRLLIAGRGAASVAAACAVLAERHLVPPRRGATSCDLLSAVDRPDALPPHVRAVARDLAAVARDVLGQDARTAVGEEDFRRAVLSAYPDRVAVRRAPASDRFLLASGSGARLSRDSGVVNAAMIVAVDVTSGSGVSAAAGEALVRLGTAVEAEWIQPASSSREHWFDDEAGAVRAADVDRYDAIVLARRPVAPDPIEAARLLATELRRRGPDDDARRWLQRLAFAGVDASFDRRAEAAAPGCTRIADVRLDASLSADERRMLNANAPATLTVPSGREVRLEYREQGQVVAAVKLQELFGLADSPRVGRNRVPVTFELLAPNGRPVQVTRDLRSFWTRGYAEVRKALRARYPKHPWPEDPWTAAPTRQTRR